ncbi:MAG TPA: hypothetical protein H9827_03365 [Candidatus Luteimonas excrementigallinarum]|nr:hypothetical protein [Candidatus Luteimonas excrementigallinarum]
MTRTLSPLMLALALALASPLAWAGTAAASGVDCEAPGSWAERTVCTSPALRGTEQQLQTLATEARQRSQDPEAFDAAQADWAGTRRDACNTVRCLQTSYASRMDELRLQVAGGRPPLLTPGTYHRHPAPEDGAPPALWIEVLDQDRYRLRVLSASDDIRPVEGEFSERVGSARFTTPGCAFALAFAPDVIVLSEAAGELCSAALEGSYLRTASEQ